MYPLDFDLLCVYNNKHINSIQFSLNKNNKVKINKHVYLT